MKYKMQVVIYNPETEEGMNSDLVMNLECVYCYDENDYGNGYHLAIEMNTGYVNHYDLRYDKNFHKDEKEAFLVRWAYFYWTGKDGAYAIKRLTIEQAD